MALDSTGRPIPVHTPDPPNHESRATAEQEQFLLVARKSDEALRQVTDLASRVAALEQAVEQPLNTTLDELRRRFDEMMLARMTDHETRFQLMADTLRALMETHTPPPSLAPPPNE
jgi:erythromycin esterase-like protein